MMQREGEWDHYTSQAENELPCELLKFSSLEHMHIYANVIIFKINFNRKQGCCNLLLFKFLKTTFCKFFGH